MGFDLDKLSRLRALTGAVEIPEWSSPGEGTERLVRDDDLRTAWSCRVRPEQPCAIGIHFPEPAELEAVRLYAIPRGEKGARSRLKRVRLHTTDGWAEARMADEDGAWHVLLGEPVRTRNVSIEVLETWGDEPLELAELEVYGRSGVARDPLVVDPSRVVITFDGPVWRQKLRTSTAGASFVETVDVDGRLRRLLPGSALVGRLGDRMLLVERASWSTCDDHQGAYDLLDTQTRVVVPLGDMGGFPGNVFRHAGGLGFAIGTASGYEVHVQGVVLDESTYERRITDRLELRKPAELLSAWGMEATPLVHDDAHPLDDPPSGCAPAKAAVLRLPDGVKVEGPHLQASRRIVTTANILEDDFRLSLPTGTVSAEGYTGFVAKVQAVDDGTALFVRGGDYTETKVFLNDAVLLNPAIDPARRARRIVLQGEIPSVVNPPPGCRFHTRCPVAQPRCKTEAPALAEVGDGRLVRCHFPYALSLQR